MILDIKVQQPAQTNKDTKNRVEYTEKYQQNLEKVK